MKLTLSVIKADIGSIGGHIQPSHELFQSVREHLAAHGRKLFVDSYLSYTGDDIAILMTHSHGSGDPAVHRLAWDAFVAGTAGMAGVGLPDAFDPGDRTTVGMTANVGPHAVPFEQSYKSLQPGRVLADRLARVA